MSCLHYHKKIQSSWPELVSKRIMYGGDSSGADGGSGAGDGGQWRWKHGGVFATGREGTDVEPTGDEGFHSDSRRIREGFHSGEEKEEPVGGGFCLIAC
ncbi:hypothetical protein L1987_02459 [Smallanthus sonchifolius]|uniref:Uncharacterized protein n=1 Tax=Smallanthus sonchifolius TaxID=185202 RepID=A0ACB9K7V1_9ASTR|nr:hypothetical protein L1987_02459 [Smallanthus sonchifolius]